LPFAQINNIEDKIAQNDEMNDNTEKYNNIQMNNNNIEKGDFIYEENNNNIPNDNDEMVNNS